MSEMDEQEREDETKYLQSLENTLERLISLATRMQGGSFGTNHYSGINHAIAIVHNLIKEQKEKLK